MEATRPWNCYHCLKVMKNPPPQHLHGSNLVVEENLALELGWDFGNIDGRPFLAEDLVFGLQAYIKYGKRVFGWHGAELLEQPPMSVKDSVRQRIRWVTGVWQALDMLKLSKDFYKLKFIERFKIRTIIGYRTLIYSLGFFAASLGFFAALVFFFFMPLWVLSFFIELDHFIIETIPFKLWRVLLLSGLILWLGSTQIGLSRILERKKVSRKTEIIERIKIFAITPIAAVVETSGALYATVIWFLGYRKVEWIPTKK
jgi:cellulose synthase/poly-beta-1,6-N-acetylglucosamine synthase-like glycosyltransferase